VVCGRVLEICHDLGLQNTEPISAPDLRKEKR